jgi:replication factor A1
VSDGDHYIQSMLATQMNHFVYNNQLKKFSIVQVEDYAVNTVKGQRSVL